MARHSSRTGHVTGVGILLLASASIAHASDTGQFYGLLRTRDLDVSYGLQSLRDAVEAELQAIQS